MKEKLQQTIPDFITNLENLITKKNSYHNLKEKNYKIKKLQKLQTNLIEELEPRNNIKSIPSSVLNLTDKEFTLNEMKILEIGLNFSVPYKHHHNLLVEAGINTELALNKATYLEDPVKEQIRFGVAEILKSEKNKPDPTVKQYAWIKSNSNHLRRRKDIVILPADKGNITVIVDRQWYDSKIYDLLMSPTYKILDHNPTKKIEETLRKLCKGLKGFKKLSKEEFNYLTPSNCLTPRFYGLPKIHKDNIPLRPIVDFRRSPTYNLARFLSNLLSSIADEHEFKLQNQYHFIHKTRSLRIPDNHKMVSFDVVSLFTNVPVESTKVYIHHRLDQSDSWKSKTNLRTEDVLKLLDLALSSNYFVWKDTVFLQLGGTPMGSPISPVFAELAMQQFEEQRIVNHEAIFFWTRFVDDCFAVIQKESEEEILQHINSYDSSIQFTVESEIEDCLPFLDTLMIRTTNGEVKRSVYRKKSHSGRYLNYKSYHPMAHKISVVDSLAFRAYVICSQDNLDKELEIIESHLIQNGYPKTFIRKRFERMRIKTEGWTYGSHLKSDEEETVRLILPYMGPLTNRLTSYIRSQIRCNFGYKPGMKLGKVITNYREPLDKPPTSGIYRIICSCNAVYIGETSRSLDVRTREHLNTDSPVNHHLTTNPGHLITLDSASLIEKENRTFHRKFKESLWIRKLPNTMNQNSGMEISPIWIATLLPFLK